MQITFLARTSALIYRRGLRQRVASLTLNCNGDFAIRAYYDHSYDKEQTKTNIVIERSVLVEHEGRKIMCMCKER